MPLRLAAKEAIVAETREVAESAISTVVADYRGMTVAEVTELRKRARANNIRLTVIRNTLAKRAFEGTDYACLEEALSGPTMLGFSLDDPGAGARLFRDYGRECPALEVKALSLNGNLYGADDLVKVANLPTRDEALAQLLSVMKAPIAKVAQTLHAVPAKLVRTLAALKDQQATADE